MNALDVITEGTTTRLYVSASQTGQVHCFRVSSGGTINFGKLSTTTSITMDVDYVHAAMSR